MKTKFCIEIVAVGLMIALLAIESPAQTESSPSSSPSKAKGSSPQAPGFTLEDFLRMVQEKNGTFRALQTSREAANARRESGDRELSPILSAAASSVDDKRPQIFGSAFSLIGNKNQEVRFDLAKKFSTGTQASLTASANEANQTLSASGAQSSTTSAFGGLGVSISQSLWKDFFGEGTALRREREMMVEQSELQGLSLQSRKIMVDAEAAFWDNLYLREELRQRQEALARAKRIESWVKNRVSNGIGDRADVLNAEGLVANRELQLLGTQDELQASEKKLRDLMELPAGEAVPALVGNLDQSRVVKSLVDGEIRLRKDNEQMAPIMNQIVSLDAYLSILEARTKALASRETDENLKPDLKLEGSYKTNSVDSSLNGAMTNISDSSKPTSRIGVSLTYMWDDGAKGATRRTAQLDATAAQQRQDRKLLESRTAWDELQRRHQELTTKIKAADRVATLQTEKAEAERDKLSKGRSVTSTVILAEQDAAESQLTLAKMRTEQRKLESQARLFIQLSEAQ